MTMIQFATTSQQAVFMPITHKFQTSTIGWYSPTGLAVQLKLMAVTSLSDGFELG